MNNMTQDIKNQYREIKFSQRFIELFSKIAIIVSSNRIARKICILVFTKLEGGPLYSSTLRAILKKYYDVEIGPYSYGPILRPALLPRGTRVGAYCSVGVDLIVRRRNHPIERLTQHPFFYNSALGYVKKDTIMNGTDNPLTIGHDVWIGDRVIIVSGCRQIGNGAVVAAGAVVSCDVDPYCVVGGVPARIIKRRFDDDTVRLIEELRWWSMPVERLAMFASDLTKPLDKSTLLAIVRRSQDKE